MYMYVYCLVLTFPKTLSLMDVKSGPVKKTLNIMDAKLSGFTVIALLTGPWGYIVCVPSSLLWNVLLHFSVGFMLQVYIYLILQDV